MGKSSLKLVKCYVSVREDEIIARALMSGELHINLTGYAIVPLEEYSDPKHAANVKEMLAEFVPTPPAETP